AAAHARGDWRIGLDEEDVHNALEHRLSLVSPEAAARMHLGRSRNDQVLAALRLYLKDAARTLHDGALHVAAALESLGEREKDTPLPGYTHLQPAMPSSVALWARGFAAELAADDAAAKRVLRRSEQNPLGSAAGHGVPRFGPDREAAPAALGFARTPGRRTALRLLRRHG